MATITKKSKYKIDKSVNSIGPVHTHISYLLAICATIIMAYITIRHWEEDRSWAISGAMQFGFVIIGLLGTQLSAQQPIFPNPDQFKPINLDTGIRALAITAISMVIQFISQAILSFTVAEEALYFVFAAISEEIFFRVLILGIFIKMDPVKKKFTLAKIFGVVIQAAAFAAIHINYHSNPPMLLSVLIGGLFLGFFYLLWEDPTANILGHLFLNIISVGNTYVFL